MMMMMMMINASIVQLEVFVYLDVSVDVVFTAAAVLPLSAGNLFDLRRLPDWIDALRVVPQKHEAVTFQRHVRLHSCDIRD